MHLLPEGRQTGLVRGRTAVSAGGTAGTALRRPGGPPCPSIPDRTWLRVNLVAEAA